MLRKIKHILTALVLMSLILGVSGCSIPLPWAPAPTLPTPSQPSSSTEHTDPNWTFPPRNNEAVTPLPSIADVVSEAMPSVVSVTTEVVVYDIFHQAYTESAAGSGFLIRGEEGYEGYVVTNNHVVENARSVQVELAGGRTFPADIVGTDALSDLAVLKIEATDLPSASAGDSLQLTVGDWVVAIGNALGEGISATQGIVSRLDVSVTVSGNTLYGLIQTTAAINPGNSGGPLVNMAGEVIGITSVKIAAVVVESMGYAISINSARPIIEDLIHQGYVTRPWLGVGLVTVDAFIAAANNLSVIEGALIAELAANSPAEAAGLKEGNVIISFEGKKIATRDDLIQAIRDCQIGQKVEITFVRGKNTKTTSAVLKESPPPWG